MKVVVVGVVLVVVAILLLTPNHRQNKNKKWSVVTRKTAPNDFGVEGTPQREN